MTPLAAEQPRLDAPARCRIARLLFNGKSLDQHRPVRKIPATRGAVLNAGVIRQRDESLRIRAVRPTRRVDRIRNQPRLHPVIPRGCEQPGFAEARWELGRRTLLRGSHQPIKASAVVGNEQLALLIDREGRDLEFGVG